MGKISAETAILQYMDPVIGPEKRLRIGDRLEIVPHSATLAIILQQRIFGVRNDAVERIFPVAGKDKARTA